MIKIFVSSVCILTITLGVARFGFTPMLPIMQAEAGLGIAEGGWVTSAHYLGYLVGVIISYTLVTTKQKEQFLMFGLLSSILSTVLMAVTTSFLYWSIIRFFAGLSGAAGVIIGAGLTMQWLQHKSNRPPQLGFYFSGVGFGIILSGLASIFFSQNQLRWNEHWLGFGVLSLLLFFPAWFLRPIINEKLITKRNSVSGEAKTENTVIDFICILSMYFFAGLGFVVSATFTLALAVERGFVQEDSLLAWLLVGVVSIPSLFFWDYVEKRASMFLALFSAIMMHALSLLLAVFFEDFSTFVISTLLFGMSNLGIVSLTMTLAGRLNPANSSKEMARLTFGFALALIVGPFFTGVVAEYSGSYDVPILIAGCLMLLGGMLIVIREFFLKKDKI